MLLNILSFFKMKMDLIMNPILQITIFFWIDIENDEDNNNIDIDDNDTIVDNKIHSPPNETIVYV